MLVSPIVPGTRAFFSVFPAELLGDESRVEEDAGETVCAPLGLGDFEGFEERREKKPEPEAKSGPGSSCAGVASCAGRARRGFSLSVKGRGISFSSTCQFENNDSFVSITKASSSSKSISSSIFSECVESSGEGRSLAPFEVKAEIEMSFPRLPSPLDFHTRYFVDKGSPKQLKRLVKNLARVACTEIVM